MPSPKAKKPPQKTPAKAKAAKVKAPEPSSPVIGDEIIYPEVEVLECWGEAAITFEQAKDILGWESEAEYIERVLSQLNEKERKAKKDKVKLPDPLFKDIEGNPVRCWRNNRNRPYDHNHALKLGQEVLTRHWAGPTTMPGETVNGETIIIGRNGEVHSAQHRLIGFCLAVQQWNSKSKGAYWKTFWETEPVLESLVVRGISNNPLIVGTLDNVKPRSNSDVFYTSELFQHLENAQKKECSRMLGRAVDMLWKRTGAGKGGFISYQTNTESSSFVDRHPKLLECIKFLFELNQERAISNLRLSPGQCSAILFLMASCRSDEASYKNQDPRSDKGLDWTEWEAATTFWDKLAKDDEDLRPVRHAIGALASSETGLGGRASEKFAILSKAWAAYLEGSIPEEELQLEYRTKESGLRYLVDSSDFGGIDVSDAKEQPEDDEAPPTPEDIQAEKDKIRREKAEELAETLKKRREQKANVKASPEAPKTPPSGKTPPKAGSKGSPAPKKGSPRPKAKS